MNYGKTIDVDAGNIGVAAASMEIMPDRLSSSFSIRPDTVFQDVSATLTPGYLEQISDAPETILSSLFSITGVRVEMSLGMEGKQQIILRGALDQILLAKIKLESMLVNRQIQTLENHKQNNLPESAKMSTSEISNHKIFESTFTEEQMLQSNNESKDKFRSRRKVCKPRKVPTLTNNSSLNVQSKTTLNNNVIEFSSLIKKEPEDVVPLSIEEEAERKANEWLSVPEFPADPIEGVKIEIHSRSSPNSLKIATPVQQPQYLYSCEICSFKAEREGQFLKHVLTHSKKETVHQCKKCSFASVSLSHYNRHQLTHIDATFNCPVCEFTSDDPKLLSRHVTLKHTISENPLKRSTLLQCNDCPYNTTKIYHFERHLLVHNRDLKGLLQVHQCEQCPYKTHRKEHIIRHRHNVHIRHRPYSCDSCHRTYKNLDSLEHHRLTHLPKQEV